MQYGDFNGYIFRYDEGRLKHTDVFVSNDSVLGLGVIGVNIEGIYDGRSKDGIGIGSERDFVISKIRMPDTTQGVSSSIDDSYYYEKNRFGIHYENYQAFRISLATPKRY